VGDDYQLDVRLVPADCVASLAHAEMLASVDIISQKELIEIRSALVKAIELSRRGKFRIDICDEDGQTALEQFVTKRTKAGMRIHSGRSRNDQVMAALRLFGRDALAKLQGSILNLSQTLLAFASRYEFTVVPGRTHSQIAMPSTLGLWAASFADELIDDIALMATCYRLTNLCPLGSAAGYGTPLPLDREMVANLLGCDGPVHNVLSAANSRGKLEAVTLDVLDQVSMTVSRLAQDLILFSLPELGYVTLPVELCTGSSIMPHKHNPDALELVRAKAAEISGLSSTVKSIVRNLPSGYHRDLQATKGPYLKAFDIVSGQVDVMTLTINRLQVCESALRKSLTPELFATDHAFDLVKEGVAFRKAYQVAADEVDRLSSDSTNELKISEEMNIRARKALAKRTATGSPGNLDLRKSRRRVATQRRRVKDAVQRTDFAISRLVGEPVSLYYSPWENTGATIA
jgi:argininosuccinate lyase